MVYKQQAARTTSIDDLELVLGILLLPQVRRRWQVGLPESLRDLREILVVGDDCSSHTRNARMHWPYQPRRCFVPDSPSVAPFSSDLHITGLGGVIAEDINHLD